MKLVCQALRTLLAASLPSGTTVIHGREETPNDTQMPMVQVVPIETEFSKLGTGTPVTVRVYHTIEVRCFVNSKEYYTSNTNKTERGTTAALEDLVEKTTDGYPTTDSVMGIILRNLNLNGTISVVESFDVRYDDIEAESYLQRATVTIRTVKEAPFSC